MISLLLPSRNRPDTLMRMYRSALDTADGEIECIVAIDEDDESYEELFTTPMKNMRLIKTPRQTLSKYWNDCYKRSSGEIVMHCGDDIIFRTKGWDTKVKEAFNEYDDKIVFVFGNDGSGVHDGRFGTHGFVSREWVETVGRFVPPYFSSDYNDTWLNDVAKLIGRHHHIDILTEHMHPDLGKAEYDITHQERLKRHKQDNVELLYASLIEERKADADKLRQKLL